MDEEKREKEIYPKYLGIGFDEKLVPHVKTATGISNIIEMKLLLNATLESIRHDEIRMIVDMKFDEILNEAEKVEVE